MQSCGRVPALPWIHVYGTKTGERRSSHTRRCVLCVCMCVFVCVCVESVEGGIAVFIYDQANCLCGWPNSHCVLYTYQGASVGINGLRKRNGLVGYLEKKTETSAASQHLEASQHSGANQARNTKRTPPPPPPPRPPGNGVAAKSTADSAMMTGHILQASSAATTRVPALPAADAHGDGGGGSSGRSIVMGTAAAGAAMGLGSMAELPGTPVAGGQTGLYTQRADAELHALEAELLSSGPPSPDRHAENV